MTESTLIDPIWINLSGGHPGDLKASATTFIPESVTGQRDSGLHFVTITVIHDCRYVVVSPTVAGLVVLHGLVEICLACHCNLGHVAAGFLVGHTDDV